jgi:hypothetical protein
METLSVSAIQHSPGLGDRFRVEFALRQSGYCLAEPGEPDGHDPKPKRKKTKQKRKPLT